MSQLKLYNTLSRQVEVFQPEQPNHARMYVCGMTVYDYCHIGHARAMMSFDIVYRWLLESGYTVVYVRNHTDVDDKILKRAAEVGEDPLALSSRFIELQEEDLGRLGLALPQHRPRVSDNIPEIIALIQRLVDRGHAYAEPGGDVYYAVESFPGYGKLSGKKLEDMRAGERIAVDERKRHPGDFVLWKAAKPGEGVSWESPWGAGRPGWHIECSAMCMRYLGETFDIHGGGIDLIFPHHENEIAQSEGGTGKAPFARYWMHNGHLTMPDLGGASEDGSVKMGKSLGNAIRIRDILDQVPAEALRLVYLETHYRSPLPYNADRVAAAVGVLDRLYQAREFVEEMQRQPAGGDTPDSLIAAFGDAARELRDASQTFSARFAEAMDNDFNTAQALEPLFVLVRAINRFGANKKAVRRGASLAGPALAAFEKAGRVLGIGGRESGEWFAEVRRQRLAAMGRSEAEVEARISARAAARAAKDWAAADEIRKEIETLGVVLMDAPSGETLWRMRVE